MAFKKKMKLFQFGGKLPILGWSLSLEKNGWTSTPVLLNGFAWPNLPTLHLPTVQPRGQGGFAVCEEQWREPSFGLQGRHKKKVEKTSKGMQLGFYPGKIRNSILMCIHTLSLVCIGLYSYCSAIAYISDTMSLRREVLPPVARAWLRSHWCAKNILPIGPSSLPCTGDCDWSESRLSKATHILVHMFFSIQTP